MPGQPFYFALEFVSRDVSEALLKDLASQVMQHLGCSRHDFPKLDEALAEAAKAAAESQRCDVQFRVQDGSLEILVLSSGGPLFQASHPLTNRS